MARGRWAALGFAMGLLAAAARYLPGVVGSPPASVMAQSGAGLAVAQSAPGVSLAQAAVVPRAFYGKRLEPKESVVLQGAGQSDEVSFVDYSKAVAPARPMLSMSYVDLRDDLPAYFARIRAELARYPELIVPQIGLSLNAGEAGKHYEAEVARGADDARLAQLCAGLRSLDRPAFLRVGYEFNGPWNGYEAASYVAAFRHVAETVRGCGLGNVAMVWDWAADQAVDAVNGGATAAEAIQRAMAFYPGDAWVDWWALNLFRAESFDAASTKAFLAEADRLGFPVMIAESTPFGHMTTEGQRVVDAWYAPYFGLIRSSRGIKAFCYIDWDWRTYPQWATWGDGRIEEDATVLRFYRGQVGSALYAYARDKKGTLALLRAR